MTDERVDTEFETVSPDSAEPDEDPVKVAFDKIMADESRGANRHVRAFNSLTPELLALVGAVFIYAKAFLETLAKRHADALENLVETRLRKNSGTTEAEIGADEGSTAKIVVTGDLPDEARLALLDLDVTSKELCGKLLRWDSSASAWRPAGES